MDTNEKTVKVYCNRGCNWSTAIISAPWDVCAGCGELMIPESIDYDEVLSMIKELDITGFSDKPNSLELIKANLGHLMGDISDSIIPISISDGEQEACFSYDDPGIKFFCVTNRCGAVISEHTKITDAIQAYNALMNYNKVIGI